MMPKGVEHSTDQYFCDTYAFVRIPMMPLPPEYASCYGRNPSANLI